VRDLAGLDALVWINPNNPTGEQVSRSQLMACQERLAAQGGWLVVDEAFMDAQPEQTLLPETGRPGLVVYRSLGKFFGLAGVRAGLVLVLPTYATNSVKPWAPGPSVIPPGT